MIFNGTKFFYTTNNTIWYEHLSISLFSSDTRFFVCSIFLTTDTLSFHCLYMKQNQTTWLIGILSIRVFFSQFIRRLFDVSKYFIDRFKNIKVFFVSLNSNEFTTTLILCYFLPFFKKSISVIMFVFINFYWKCIVMKI